MSNVLFSSLSPLHSFTHTLPIIIVFSLVKSQDTKDQLQPPQTPSFVCEVVSVILPETCRLESMEALAETPYCPPRTRHRAACYWSLILSSETLPGQMLRTSATPNRVNSELTIRKSLKCVFDIIVWRCWPLTFLSGSNSMSYWQPVSCSQCEAPSWQPNETTTTSIECSSRDLWKIRSYTKDDNNN